MVLSRAGMFHVSFKDFRHIVLILFIVFGKACLLGSFSSQQILSFVYVGQMQMLAFRWMLRLLSFRIFFEQNERSLWSIGLDLEDGVPFGFGWEAV